METNTKCFIDGIKPTIEMNEDELRQFSDGARKEIKRLIGMVQTVSSERDELAAKLDEAKEKPKKAQESAEYWQKSWSEVYDKYNELKSQLAALSTIIAALTK